MSGIGTDRERLVVPLLRRYGRTASAFRAVGPDLACWMAPQGDAVVAYAASAGAMVAAGEPIADLPELVPVAEGFLAYARSVGKRASFFATEGRLAPSPQLRRWLIGEQPVWDPRDWSSHLASHRSLREQVRRARAKGIRVQALDADTVHASPIRETVAAMLARWRATRGMAAMAFLVSVDLVSASAERRYLLAWHHGELAALLVLAPVPARNGWVFEHVLRDPDAPNGTLELLVDHMMRQLADEQVAWATLGLAPLHGEVAPWLRHVRRWSTPLFNFEGLAAFKRKLRPAAWVAFDGALLLTLRHLRRASARHGPSARTYAARVATAVATAVTIDAALTLLQAVLWNAPRLQTRFEWTTVLVACAAPALAAPLLWGATQRLRTLARARPRLPALHFVA